MNFLPVDNTPYWLLDSVIGWQAAQQSGIVEYGTEGNLRLRSLTGTARLFFNGSPGGMQCPVAAALDECGVLLVLDAAHNRMWRVRMDTGETRVIEEIGGRGSAARRFDTPRGFALLPGGGTAVADTNNHRVQVFSAPPYALLQLWGTDDNRPGSGPLQFNYPSGIAYGPDGFLYIADRGNARIQRVRPDGSRWSEIGTGVLVSPIQVAVSPAGYVAVCDAAPAPTGSRVVVFAPGNWTSQILAAGDAPLSLVFDPAGNLYAGTSKGLVFEWTADFQTTGAGTISSSGTTVTGNSATTFIANLSAGDTIVANGQSRVVTLVNSNNSLTVGEAFSPALPAKTPYSFQGAAGAGVTGLDGAIQGLAWLGNANALLAIVNQQDVTPLQRLWKVPAVGAFVAGGTFCCGPLDSRIENCAWHRIQVEGNVPAGTSLQIDTVTTPDTGAPSAAWQTALLSPPPIPAGQLEALLGTPTAAQTPTGAYQNPDALVQSGPGRYLRLRITMVSSGAASPEIHAIKVYFPRQSYLRYLPANFQDDEQSRLFLDRFLSVFQTSFDAFDRRIDNMWRLFDPMSTPQSWYNWLAAWVALPINPDWTLAKKRQMLANSAAQNLVRGTLAGLQQAIQDYAGVQGSVLEHFRLRRWPMILSKAAPPAGSMTQYDARLCAATPLWSRAFAARLQVGKYSTIGSFELVGSGSPVTDAFTWGASQFTVFFPADPYNPSATTTKVQQVVEREKPAHTQAFYVPIFPRMRVGVQASIGVDSYVSRITYTALNRVATLGYDAVLGQSRARRQVAALGTSVPPLTGLNTRLL